MFMTLSTILTIFVVIYILIGLLNHIGLSKIYSTTTLKPSVTVLIAARNEEAFIAQCLTSLENLQYPKEMLQIIILNDRSTDQTRQIALSYSDRLVHFTLIDIEKDVDGLSGKMNALSQGLDQAEGDIILVTDADCRVQPAWVDQMCAYFADDTAMVGGLTVIGEDNNRRSETFLKLQQLDWLFLQSIASGSAGIGIPVSILGNNFGFRRSVYEKLGGFRSIGFSLTEDMALLRKMVGSTNHRLAYKLNDQNMVRTFPFNRFKDFLEQRKRWLRGGIRVNIWGWIMMSISFTAHLMICGGIFIFPLNPHFISALAAVLVLDYSLVWRIGMRINLRVHLLYFIAYELFYIFYSILLTINLISRSPISWKERTYKES